MSREHRRNRAETRFFLQHTFIVTFASLADRDYYLTDDPIHNKFKALVGPAIEEAFVYDFDAGVF